MDILSNTPNFEPPIVEAIHELPLRLAYSPLCSSQKILKSVALQRFLIFFGLKQVALSAACFKEPLILDKAKD
jgi:hypothetical protein